MKANYHTHTFRCFHAEGTEKDYIESALRNGLTTLGFSDHGPFPDKDFGLRMKYEDLPEHLGTIEKLKPEYDGKLRIYKGLEIEYFPQYLDYYKSLLKDRGLDYLLLGEHMYIKNGKVRNIFFAEKTEDYVDYAENIAEAASTGLFCCIAHPDLMMINEFPWDKNCDKASDIIISAAEKYNLPLEFNANGYRRQIHGYSDGDRYPYPDERFWKQLSGSNIRVVIGSDCHIPAQVCDDAIALAEKEIIRLSLNLTERIIG